MVTGNGSYQTFSRPENDEKIMSSWERFMGGQDPGSDALRRLIDDSWRRCHGIVDPGRSHAPDPVVEDALHDILGDNRDLVRASTPVMASARDFLLETGTVMVLTDAQGVVLSVEGDRALRDPTERIRLMPGANWSEAVCGTNAIGTALQIGQPIQIHSAEHYCSGIKRWSCSASVIRDPLSGATLGAIDLSGLSESYSRHSLALAVAASGRIENRLAQREMKLRYRLLDHCLERLRAPGGDGLIVFDRSGRAIKTNDRAATLMAELAKGRGTVAGAIRDLTLPWRAGRVTPENMPDWIDRDWIEPVLLDGERLGAMLVLPDRSAVVRRAGLRAVPRSTPASADPFDRLSGCSPAYLEAVRRARLLAKSPAPVLLLGETGVGKDAFAQALHAGGAHGTGPFVAINCGGFSRELLTSELFGYAEGAFTGARRGGMTGKIEAADGGTLFLDEIGEMPLDLQPHLLRVLEAGEVYRIGENRPRKVRLRLIAATNRDLKAEVEAGHFRADLFYRVAVTTLRLPSLRERAGDLAALAEHLLGEIARRYEIPAPDIKPEVLGVFSQHDWPGNIRELRNVLESMVLESGGASLGLCHLPSELGSARFSSVAFPPPAAASGTLERAESDAILAAIRRHHGNLTSAARDLGIAKSTLYVRIERLGLKGSVDLMRG
ncbi:sigma-54-dependent Fis family transcriptional regulator [Allorhizobium borbori]|uniref:Transcriptional regulator of acetoin/glycerol metabolism n=1 Tax=Allorhizobium borbori TaxID=485907 RepID=A0A7W6K4G5_9HYPH|nr:sigma-54-dependent Fis family transcriptional regulator [Allorhizobium borbori]MBB4105029.1 transcriptional regulator of acetoin/glycerol metabolism [Allorhizobium borbori]